MSESNSRGVSLHQANLRIAELCHQSVETFSDRENLDMPMDGDMRITGGPKAFKLSLVIDGIEVSWTGLRDFQQQIGGQLVRMCGLAGVGTHNDHRFKGYSRRVMINALRWMRREGYDVSMLYGITGFYPKYGFAPAFPVVTYSMAVRDAELVRSRGLKFVDFDDTHLRAVLAMFHKNNAGLTGVTTRSVATWAPFRRDKAWGVRPLARVALDKRGRPCGYLAFDLGDGDLVLEVGYVSPDVLADLLHEARRLTWERRHDTVRFMLTDGEPLMEFARQFGLKKEIQYRRDGKGMVRMISVPSALTKVAPLLASRMSGRGSLNLRTNLDSVGLRWSDGQMRVGAVSPAGPQVCLPQWALAQLLYGYYGAASPSLRGVIKTSPAGLDCLTRMFPQQVPHHSKVDEF